MIRNIVTNSEKLRIISNEVDMCSGYAHIIKDLFDTAKFHRRGQIGCAGLAANQIGEFQRIIVIWFGDRFMPMINPVIIEHWGGRFGAHESCLSVMGKRSYMKRHKKIRVQYYEHATQHKIERVFSKFTARVIQHEVDHLDGRTI